MEETIDRSEFDDLPINLSDSQNDVILTEAKNPPQMFYTEWETSISNDGESSDNAKLLQKVPNLPK